MCQVSCNHNSERLMKTRHAYQNSSWPMVLLENYHSNPNKKLNIRMAVFPATFTISHTKKGQGCEMLLIFAHLL